MTWRFFKFIYIVLGVECIIFALFYYAGYHGIRQVQLLYQERQNVMQQIQICTIEKQQLQDELQAWEHDDFVKEQYARERLHMKKKEEVVYFINNDKK